MVSNIDPSLESQTSGPHIGKVLIDDLRLQLTRARDESTAHGTAIDVLQSDLEGLQENTETLAQAIVDLSTSNSNSLNALDISIPGKVRGAVLTGLSLLTASVISEADSVLSALGKLQAQFTKFIDQVNVFTKAQRGAIVALNPVSNTYTPDASAGNFFSFTAGANFTLANPTNLPAAGITQSGSFFITQDATGNRTISFGNKYQAAGGLSTIVLSTGANVKDRIDYVIGTAGYIHVSIAKDIKA